MRWIIIILLFVLLSGINSCKKGCTDQAAINYNSKVNSEDGSCLYCDSSYVEASSNTRNVRDTFSGSPLKNEYVIRADVQARKSIYTGNACKGLGFDDENKCTHYYHDAVLYNLIDKTITFSGKLRLVYNTGTFNYSVSNVVIAPNSNYSITDVGNACISGSGISSFSLTVREYSLQYQ